MNNKKQVAQAVKDAVGTVYKDDWCKKAGWEIDKPTVIIAFREAVNQIVPEEEPIYKGGMRTGRDPTWQETKQEERQKIRASFLQLCDELDQL
jgi:hypothetical protein